LVPRAQQALIQQCQGLKVRKALPVLMERLPLPVLKVL
jgi:hypothetical protein